MRRTLNEYEDIIRFEVRRAGRIYGYDRADTMQEMRAHVAIYCLPKINGNNSGRTYVRRAIRNALVNLRRGSESKKRIPHDKYGQIMPLAWLDEWIEEDEGYSDRLKQLVGPEDPEQELIAKQTIARINEGLTQEERTALASMLRLEGASAVLAARMSRKSLRRIASRAHLLHRVSSREEAKMTKTADIPECHADGSDPLGYETDPDEAQDCQDCPDKFSCLPKAIDQGLIEAELAIDPEVEAVKKTKILSLDDAVNRVKRRQEIRKNGGSVPTHLLFNNVSKEEAAMSEEETENTEETETKKTKKTKKKTSPKGDASKKSSSKKKSGTKKKGSSKKSGTKKKSGTTSTSKKSSAKKKGSEASDEGAKKTKKKSSSKKSGTKKSSSKKKADAKKTKKKSSSKKSGTKKKGSSKKKKEGRKRKEVPEVAEPTYMDDGRLVLPNGRVCPGPKSLTEEQMANSLERVELGTDFPIDIGMTIIKKTRDGDVKVRVRKNGYEMTCDWLPEDINGSVFPSLSACSQHASFRNSSGNEYFNVEKNRNIVIKGKNVPNKTFKSADLEEE